MVFIILFLFIICPIKSEAFTPGVIPLTSESSLSESLKSAPTKKIKLFEKKVKKLSRVKKPILLLIGLILLGVSILLTVLVFTVGQSFLVPAVLISAFTALLLMITVSNDKNSISTAAVIIGILNLIFVFTQGGRDD